MFQGFLKLFHNSKRIFFLELYSKCSANIEKIPMYILNVPKVFPKYSGVIRNYPMSSEVVPKFKKDNFFGTLF